MLEWLVIPAGYLVGSTPIGLMIAKSRGVDPRDHGSGNIGATNVGRLLGAKFFALVFTLDLLKGALPVLVSTLLVDDPLSLGAAWLFVATAAACVLGHVFSLFLKFKGGKGVATSLGVTLGLFPFFTVPGVAAALVFLVVFKLTKYVSVASMVAAISFPVAYVTTALLAGWPVFGAHWPLLAVGTAIPTLILVKHRDNVRRLLSGQEHRFDGRPDEIRQTR